MTTEHEGIWRYGEQRCPKCRYELTIPLRPSDSKVETFSSLWCPRCGHTWATKTPISDVK